MTIDRRLTAGGILGDIAGSVYEFDNIKTKKFTLFADYHHHACIFTDDTVMTLAVCDALMHCRSDYADLSERCIESMQKIGRYYPECGYGSSFFHWIYDDPVPYNSFGNGSAMRVSPVAYVSDSLEQTEKLAEETAAVSHSHPEGIKGAVTTAGCVYLALHGNSKEAIRQYVTKRYDLDFTIDQIRPAYTSDVTCQGSVPQAIEAFLESNDYEDSLRTAISLGGDSDTIACMTGSIAGPYYGISEDLQNICLSYLDDRLKEIYLAFIKGENTCL